MTRYAIYQLPSESKHMRDLFFMKPSQIEAISDEYEIVAVLKAKSLDEVFTIGNFIGVDSESSESRFEFLTKMRSVSVGDIIHDMDVDCTFVVERFGFARIMMKESVE